VTSCEKDLYEDTIKNNSEKIKVTDVSVSNLNIETAKKINQKISSLKSEANKNGEGKFEYNSSLGFYIDTEDGKLIEKDGKLFYTFPMFRESEEKLENVVFTTKSNGDLEAYLVKYNLTPEQYLTSASNENITAQYAKFTGDQMCINFISETTIYPNCDQPNGLHSNGKRCEGQIIVTSIEFCTNTGGGGSDTAGGTTSGNSSSGNGTIGQNGPLGGGSGGGVPTDIGEIITVTIPLSQQQINIRNFITSLNEEQSDWYFSQEPEVTTSIIAYLVQNNFSIESENIVKDFISSNINGLPIIISPDNPISDINSFLSCVNKNGTATVTVYCLQPIKNSASAYSNTFVGHTFISIKQGNIKKVIGFYPQSNWITPIYNTSSGVLGNDSGESYNASVSINVNSVQLTNIVNYIIGHSSSQYNLNNYNCTDFAIAIGNLAGLNLPDAYGTWPGGGGSNPGTLGQHIINMSGASINVNSSVTSNFAAPTSTDCP
jgi:hypothetical protein